MAGSRTILVTGATGTQGGVTARELLRRGHTVHALVRDPDKAQAQALQERGAVLVRGDLEETGSLRRAMEGVDGVFSVQATGDTPREIAAEVRQGKNVADTAVQAGVAHLVYSSVEGAERGTGIDHFESKYEVEQHIRALGLSATVLRPVFFLDNLLGFADAEGERLMQLPIRAQRPIQMVAGQDIAFFAANAFEDPHEYAGRTIALAGDEITFAAIAQLFERITGTPTRFEPVLPIEDPMLRWFDQHGYRADIAAVRREHPGLLTAEQFLTRRLSPTGH
ncbi:NmrA/HSCARG family protein [Nocardiopsis sp. HNM0947]|uniref:NmrA/HSCARG family protein n=1 Tax=Nocardiopsis coralli TaxID=2772213 RepID=A0ABR9P6V9_9ACTN|nr:NmrA/HSCARG family protein [Nocardiopsis coralli]MBE2999577.1 NmrA/HSCARG family protein [Nocardiopsis coralli]